MKLFSPSKVNLFLRVVRRREDGFHDLASMFHAIDLGDIMKVRNVFYAQMTMTSANPSYILWEECTSLDLD